MKTFIKLLVAMSLLTTSSMAYSDERSDLISFKERLNSFIQKVHKTEEANVKKEMLTSILIKIESKLNENFQERRENGEEITQVEQNYLREINNFSGQLAQLNTSEELDQFANYFQAEHEQASVLLSIFGIVGLVYLIGFIFGLW